MDSRGAGIGPQLHWTSHFRTVPFTEYPTGCMRSMFGSASVTTEPRVGWRHDADPNAPRANAWHVASHRHGCTARPRNSGPIAPVAPLAPMGPASLLSLLADQSTRLRQLRPSAPSVQELRSAQTAQPGPYLPFAWDTVADGLCQRGQEALRTNDPPMCCASA